MSMEHVKQIFISEAQEQLVVMEQRLLEVEVGDVDITENIDAIFRAAHTIKGSAGIFGYDDVVGFSHTVENVLDEIRSGSLGFDLKLASTLLDSHLYLESLIFALSNPELTPKDEQGEKLVTQLQSYLSQGDEVEDAFDQHAQSWLINITYSENVFRDGMDPVSQINFLDTLGEVKHVELHTHFPESLDGYQAESCYIRLAIEFVSNAQQQEIEDVFEFILDSSEVSIVKKDAQHISDVEAANQQPIGDDTDTVLVDVEQKKSFDNQYIKVDAGKLDTLINLIGELTTSSASNEMLAQNSNDAGLVESLDHTVQLVEKIRDHALGLRLVKMNDTFNRLKRIVRDIAKEQGKHVRLTLIGGDAELDKTIVDRLIDPLMHLVRNAIDHGIESPETRLRNGKSGQGNIEIRAYHEAGTFIIEVEDNGEGINQEKILEKAIDTGLITADQLLSVDELHQLIFAPGLSTAETISTISGRGVGMDVVKRDIENLRGQIKVISVQGKGTYFKIRLPLTLAIIDGLEVMVGDTHLVIPSNLIRGCLPFDTQLMGAESDILNLRGEMVPFVRMNDVLNIQPNLNSRKHMVMVQFGSQKAGLLVEDILGELQAVVKPLNAIFNSLKGIGGSTILRTGDVGFILDIPQLIQLAAHNESVYLQAQENSQMMKVEHV